VSWLETLPHCALYGKPVLAALHVFGDLGTGLAYMAIPIAIEHVRARRRIPFSFLAVLFAAFIFLCGAGHFLNAASMLTGTPAVYWLEGANKFLTAIVSLLTAYYAILIIPKLVAIPSAEQWDKALETIQNYRNAEAWRQLGKPKA
jgi:hypothetical protein